MSAKLTVLRRPEGAARWFVLAAVVLALVFLVVPLIAVFAVAFSKGAPAFVRAISSADTLSAVKLTLLAVGVSVPLNTLFGVAAAWAITKHDFRGKALLITLIDVPFAVSPVVAGIVFVFLFGANGLLGPWLMAHDLRVVFAPPGIILATVFVTFPFVARELIPLMESIGRDEELAAVSLGAGGWAVFSRVTLPNIRWGLFYGVVVCTARALGEFGAVSVVSGHVRGVTNTVPLHVEILYNEYDQAGAFAVASLLGTVGVIALIVKKVIERRLEKELSA
jgi:sulfate transport system permease protein